MKKTLEQRINEQCQRIDETMSKLGSIDAEKYPHLKKSVRKKMRQQEAHLRRLLDTQKFKRAFGVDC